ncbi:MAG TPA: hypothetical protein PLN56_09340 [Methanoregulaceae archaeon]|jgi:rRNA maturation protein Nop10|nr:hypothetical protein [Methanoregulaceae archaeon]
MALTFPHTEYSNGFMVHGPLPRTFGPVHRYGKIYYRNYRRELKNGKGLSIVDVVFKDRAQAMMRIATNLCGNIF